MPDNHPHYPSPAEVDAWCAAIVGAARTRPLAGRLLDAPVWDFKLGVRHTGGRYVAFEAPSRPAFYGFWQPAPSGRGPLLVHVPGYGAEMSAHPELVAEGYCVLDVNPLGYATPQGPDASRQSPLGAWPVLPDTVSSLGRSGYVDWLADAASAVFWGLAQPEVDGGRFATFGTSQGGGCALLLASLFADHGVRAAAADVPFLIGFALMDGRADKGAYASALDVVDRMRETAPQDVPAAWKALGFVDVLSHVHRLTMPVLLTSGSLDATCPPETIRALFDRLPGTRCLAELSGQGHAYTQPFLHLTRGWMRNFL